MNRRSAGRIAEQLAAEYLVMRGCTVLERNRRIAGVEVDIVAADGRTLVFVEVKSSDFFDARPAEHVTDTQMLRYVRAAEAYLASHGLSGVPVRFDVAEVTDGRVVYTEDAFDASTPKKRRK